MANVLIIRRGCSCRSCVESKILVRWKNANRFNIELETLLQATSQEKTLQAIQQRVVTDKINTVVLLVNLGCDILPELSLQDLDDLKVIAEKRAQVLSSSDIYGIAHRQYEDHSQERYEIFHPKQAG